MEYSTGLFNLYDSEYRSVEAISKSGLDLIHKSPSCFKNKVQTFTPALAFGTLLHTRLLEPESYKEFSKELIKGFATMKAQEKAMDKIEKIHTKLKSVREWQEAFKNAEFTEVSMFWSTSPDLRCKGKPDLITKDGWIWDVKSTTDSSIKAFQKSIANYRYHMQAAFYYDGYIANKRVAKGFKFLSVEKEEPYNIAMYVCDEEMIAQGRFEYLQDLSIYEQCLKSDHWPELYEQGVQEISLPGWYG